MDRAKNGLRLTGWIGASMGLQVRPHGLRYAAITEALEATHGDVRKVQRFSRLRDVRTLAVYDDPRRDIGEEVAKLVAESV